jgi:hypothetical protein
MDRIDDARCWATQRAAGTVRIMLEIEPLLEDLEGAIAEHDTAYAMYLAREYVLRCAAILSMCRGGPVDIDNSLTTADVFTNLPDSLVSQLADLALAPVQGGDITDPGWLDALRELLRQVQTALGIDSLPLIRTREGMFPALAAARDAVDLCVALGGPVVAVPSS